MRRYYCNSPRDTNTLAPVQFATNAIRAQVIKIHEKHPEYTFSQIAYQFGLYPAQVEVIIKEHDRQVEGARNDEQP